MRFGRKSCCGTVALTSEGIQYNFGTGRMQKPEIYPAQTDEPQIFAFRTKAVNVMNSHFRRPGGDA